MLMVKGTRVAFDLADGAEIDVRPGLGMMHDPDGKAWPRCSLLIGPFTKGRAMSSPPSAWGAARQYYGRQYAVRQGEVNLPPRALSGWERLGPVTQIWYTRVGSKYRRSGERPDFRHEYNKPGLLTRMFKGKGRPPVLYSRGEFLRLEMQAGCMLDARGIVFP
jgi:hypothetical protein